MRFTFDCKHIKELEEQIYTIRYHTEAIAKGFERPIQLLEFLDGTDGSMEIAIRLGPKPLPKPVEEPAEPAEPAAF